MHAWVLLGFLAITPLSIWTVVGVPSIWLIGTLVYHHMKIKQHLQAQDKKIDAIHSMMTEKGNDTNALSE